MSAVSDPLLAMRKAADVMQLKNEILKLQEELNRTLRVLNDREQENSRLCQSVSDLRDAAIKRDLELTAARQVAGTRDAESRFREARASSTVHAAQQDMALLQQELEEERGKRMKLADEKNRMEHELRLQLHNAAELTRAEEAAKHQATAREEALREKVEALQMQLLAKSQDVDAAVKALGSALEDAKQAQDAAKLAIGERERHVKELQEQVALLSESESTRSSEQQARLSALIASFNHLRETCEQQAEEMNQLAASRRTAEEDKRKLKERLKEVTSLAASLKADKDKVSEALNQQTAKLHSMQQQLTYEQYKAKEAGVRAETYSLCGMPQVHDEAPASSLQSDTSGRSSPGPADQSIHTVLRAQLALSKLRSSVGVLTSRSTPTASPAKGLLPAAGGTGSSARTIAKATESGDSHAGVQASANLLERLAALVADGSPQPSNAQQPSLLNYHGMPPLPSPQQPAPSLGALSWEDWLSFFEQADAAAERKRHLSVELREAVRQENYAQAAQLKAELRMLEANDAVASTRTQLAAALAEERYADASQLRDAGLASLEGWWAGRGVEDDPVGHLLHVTPEYGRWTGRVFRPRDLAELKVHKPLDPFGRSFSSSMRGAFGGAGKPTGSPMLEVFVRPEDDSTGVTGRTHQHQAVSLRLPTSEEVEQRRFKSQAATTSAAPSPPPTPPPSPSSGPEPVEPAASSSSSSLDSPAAAAAATPPPPSPRSFEPVVRLSVSIRPDGTASIRPMLPPFSSPSSPPASASTSASDAFRVPPPPEVRSHFSAWEAAEAEETLRLLRWAGPSGSSSGAGPSSGGAAGGDVRYAAVAVEPDEVVQLPEIPDEALDIIDIGSQNAMSSLEDGEDSSVTIVTELVEGVPLDDEIDGDALHRHHRLTSARGGGSGPFGGGLGYNGVGPFSTPLPDEVDGLEEYAELTRVPARVELQGRDRFVYHMPEDAGPTRPDAGWAAWDPRRRTAGARGGWPAVPAPQQPWPPVPPPSASVPPTSLLRARAEASAAAGVEEGTSSFEVILPIAASPVDEAEAGTISAPRDAVAADTLNVLADQVHQSMEAKAGRAAAREEIADALREVVRRVAAGEPAASVDVLLGEAVGGQYEAASGIGRAPAAVQSRAAPAPPAPKMTSINYQRISLDNMRSTDPLTGLYIGSFGPHGPELLQLSRTVIDGEEMVLATKLTGDHNVPAGLVSFRAKVGRKQRLDARDAYPEELGITARYKGEGRVAQKNKAFPQPRWVDGELLVFGSKGGSLTAGAELGFVWSVPNEKRFLILLNRVDLGNAGSAK